MTQVNKESVDLVKTGLEMGLPPDAGAASAALQEVRGESPEQADAEVAEAFKEEGVGSGDADA